MSIITTVHPPYEVLKALGSADKRFRDFLALGIQKATLAKLLIELEEKKFIERKIVSTRPFKTEYSITPLGRKVLKLTTEQAKKELEAQLHTS
jgi:DNA-binding HxlR family transcriptional regulator